MADGDGGISTEANAIDAAIAAVKSELIENPYKYDQHVLLIGILKENKKTEMLRDARQRMSEIFPLTEALWLDWFHDEMSQELTEDEEQMVVTLFERAVKDYLSVTLWLEYSQFCMKQMGRPGGLEKCRDVMERALVLAGVHVTSGSLLWEMYREFELALLSNMKNSQDAKEVHLQHSRVTNLFKRQLGVSLIDMHKTLQEFTNWTSTKAVDADIETAYNKALTKLKKIQKFEDALLLAESPNESIYKEYLEYELKEGDPTSVQCLFERSIVDNCLSTSLWEQYVGFLDSSIKDASIVLPVYERATRNCPWCLKLWQGYLRALERCDEPREKIKGIVELALSSGFATADDYRELWLTYLDYLRRGIHWSEDHSERLEILRATFERANEHLMNTFGLNGDPSCCILQYWARIEGRYCKNMNKAREIWKDIMDIGHSHHARMWLEQCSLERNFGDAKHTRKMFGRGLLAASDYPELVGEAWLQFERDEGTLAQWEFASSRVDTLVKAFRESQFSETRDAVQMDASKKNVKRKRNFAPDTNQPVAKKAQKRKLQDDESAAPEGKTSVTPEKKKKVKRSVTNDAIERDERHLFLSNLSFETTEDEIKELFTKVGEIKNIELMRDKQGRSKGFGYIEFSTADQASCALGKDREKLNGRPVFVSKCEDKSKRSQSNKFKYREDMETNKLFVRGLPFSATQQDVENLFKQFGDVKVARLVTYRNGNSKGYAFVEYGDEVMANEARSKTDGMTIDGHKISVAISNPSEKKPKVDDLPKETDTPNPRSHRRTQITLLPRSLMKVSPAITGAVQISNGSKESSNR